MEVEINVKNPKLKRTLDRFKAKISSGDFYEAHQTLRTIANRNVRSKSYEDAIDLLYHGSIILLKSSQPTTGSDLVLYLLEVYNESELKVDANSKSKLIELIPLFDSKEPTLKQVSIETINWSIKFGDQKFGDSDLHFVIAQKLLQNEELVYDSERHLLLSNVGYKLYTDLIWKWYSQDSNKLNIDKYIARIVLKYLTIGNFKNAKDSLNLLIKKFIEYDADIKYEIINEFNTETLIFNELPLLNCLQLLIITIQTKNTAYFKKLLNRYQLNIKEFNDIFNLIGEIYFDITVPKQANLLQDLMGGLFK